MLGHNLIPIQSKNYSVDIVELPDMKVIATINPKLQGYRSLCVTKDHYIFGFNFGIARYSKSFQLIDTYKSKDYVYSIVPYHNDGGILVLGEFDNNIEIVDCNSMSLLNHF
jgi:hypothetical protein